MKTCRQALCAFISAAFLSCTVACGIARSATETGKIVGTVLDEKGVPLAAAKVNVLPLDGRPQGTGIRYVETDVEGRFVIDRLPWGKYSVFAMKEEAEYPDMEPSFYSAGMKIPTAIIMPSAPVATLSIHLGQRAAIIDGSVSNASTGAPVSAFFTLVRMNNLEDFLSTSVPSTYRILVPAFTDVAFSVTAPGYDKWTSPRPGQELQIDVELVPTYNPNVPSAEFLIPDGYVGWALLTYNQKSAPPMTTTEGATIYKFPEGGRLKTSSPGPAPDAKKSYLYYAGDGSLRDVPMDYRNGNGMIWDEHSISVHGSITEFGFFVGTKDQYENAKTRRPFQQNVEQ